MTTDRAFTFSGCRFPEITLHSLSTVSPRFSPLSRSISALFLVALTLFALPGAVAADSETSDSAPSVALFAERSFEEVLAEAETALVEGRIDDALGLFGVAIDLDPEAPAPRLHQALILLNFDEPALALSILLDAIGDCPPTGELHAFAGVALFRLGRAVEAVEQFKTALALPDLADAQRPQVHNLLGLAHLALLEWDEAQTAFRAALRHDPDFVEAQTNLAIYFRHRRQPDRVFESYDRALRLDPDHVPALRGRAEQNGILHRHLRAKTDLDRALALVEADGRAAERHPALFWNAALIEWRLGDTDAAHRHAENTLALDPLSPEGEALIGFLETNASNQTPTPAREVNRLLREAKAAEEDERYTSAVLFLAAADLQAPGDDRALHARGRVHAKAGDYARALDALDRAILAFDRDADSAYWRGRVAFDLARYHEAVVHHRRALALRGRFCEPWLGLANASLQIRRFADAVVAYDNYAQCGEIDARFHNNRGVANWNLNLPDQALEDFNRALELDPEYTTALFNRGVLLAELGDLEGACRDLRRVRTAWPEEPEVERWIGALACEAPAPPAPPPPTPEPTETRTDTPPTPTDTVPTPEPTSEPTPEPTPTPSPTATPEPTPEPTPTPTPRPTPVESPTPIPTSPPVPTPPPPPVVVLTPAPSPTPAGPPERTPPPPPPPPSPPSAPPTSVPAVVAPTPVPTTRLDVLTDPPGAFVAVNGQYVGPSPVQLPVAQGDEHRITILGDKRIVQELTYLPPKGQTATSVRVQLGPMATLHDLKMDAARLQKRLDAQPDNPLLLVQMGEVALAENSYELGAQLAARALELAPEFAYAEKALGIYQANIAFRLQNAARTDAEKADADTLMALAAMHLENARAAFPEAPWALVAHATPKVLAGDYDAAQATFETALAKDPRYVPAINSLAGLEIQRAFRATPPAARARHVAAARAHLDKALAIQSDSVDALTRLALLAGAVDANNARALELAERAMRIDPADPQPFIIRGNAYLALQRLDEARDDLIRALVLNPNDPNTRKTLEMIFEHEVRSTPPPVPSGR